MNIIYLKTTENWQEAVKGIINKWNTYVKKLEYWFRRIFYIASTYNVYPNNIEYILPYKDTETKKIIKFLNTKNVQGIILDKNLSNNYEVLNRIQEKNIYLFNGKWLFKYLIIETLEYICEKTSIKMDTVNVAILVNDITDDTIQTIYKIAEKIKSISIVTKEINKFRRIETKLYEEKGIPIKITNNKRKSLKNESIIINMDFTEKELNQYSISQDAIIINVKNNVNNVNKSFRGININNFEIEKTEYDINGFTSNSVYETIVYKKDTFDNIKLQIKKDRIKIKYLIGKRGKIEENEYKNFLKKY